MATPAGSRQVIGGQRRRDRGRELERVGVVSACSRAGTGRWVGALGGGLCGAQRREKEGAGRERAKPRDVFLCVGRWFFRIV
jgi:hypothetical protein